MRSHAEGGLAVGEVSTEKYFELDLLVDPTERSFARFFRIFQIEPVLRDRRICVVAQFGENISQRRKARKERDELVSPLRSLRLGERKNPQTEPVSIFDMLSNSSIYFKRVLQPAILWTKSRPIHVRQT